MKLQIIKDLRKVVPGFPVKCYPLTNSGNRIREATSVLGGCTHGFEMCWFCGPCWHRLLANMTEWLQSSEATLLTSAKKGPIVKRFGIFRNKTGQFISTFTSNNPPQTIKREGLLQKTQTCHHLVLEQCHSFIHLLIRSFIHSFQECLTASDIKLAKILSEILVFKANHAIVMD